MKHSLVSLSMAAATMPLDLFAWSHRQVSNHAIKSGGVTATIGHLATTTLALGVGMSVTLFFGWYLSSLPPAPKPLESSHQA
jgi:hypothetical protein